MSRRRLAVALWGTTAEVLADPAVSVHRLTSAEQRRGERLVRADDRDSFRAAHLLARACAVRIGLVYEDIELRQWCPTCGGDHGVPWFPAAPDVHVSIAHTRGAVIAAVSSTAIGVDIEAVRALRLSDLDPVLSVDETAWLRSHPDDAIRIWCRKEAAVKASGVGVRGMRDVDAVRGDWNEATADGFQLCVATVSPIALARVRSL